MVANDVKINAIPVIILLKKLIILHAAPLAKYRKLEEALLVLPLILFTAM